MLIQIASNPNHVHAAFSHLNHSAHNLGPVLRDIGEHLVNSTKQRFRDQKTPDGRRWMPNSVATLYSFVGKKDGGKGFTKQGNFSARGKKSLQNKRILFGHSHELSHRIHYSLTAGNGVQIGSPMKYAAIQHFGGSTGRNKATRIPARPFLGLSPSDQAYIIHRFTAHLHQP